ncbi:UNVERIFIED_CONTAM: hypothetical protein FKN15_025229 [Acipenser sinensis]
MVHGDTEVCKNPCKCFQIESQSVLLAYRECKETRGEIMPEGLKHLMTAVNSVTILSAECERSCSQLNHIVTSMCTAISMERTSALLFLKLVSSPLEKFNPDSYVQAWIAKSKHSAAGKVKNTRNPHHDLQKKKI